MSSAETKEKWLETLKQVFQRSATDADFRKRCLEDPHGVLEEVSGIEVPAGTEIRFVEEVSEHVFRLPPLLEEVGELSSEELQQVAGGIQRSPGRAMAECDTELQCTVGFACTDFPNCCTTHATCL